MKRIVPLIAASVASALLLAGGFTPASASESAARCTWRKAYELPRAVFEDVSVSPDGTVWAVGWMGSRTAFPVISRWNGTSWETEIGKVRGKHWQVHARSASEVWITGTLHGEWILYTYDGHGWKTERRPVDFANPANPHEFWISERRRLIGLHEDGSQTELVVPRSIDYWGQFAVDLSGGVWIDDDSNFYTWNGQRWLPKVHTADGGVMAASTSKDVWSVGNSILHWDGTAVRRIRHGGTYQVMHDVDAMPGKALVVGQDWGRGSARGHGVIAEWNGKRFRNTTYLGTRSPVNNAVSDVATVESITGVAFASERVAWAVGWGKFVSLGVIYRGVCRW